MNFQLFLFEPVLFEYCNHLAGTTFAFKRVRRVGFLLTLTCLGLSMGALKGCFHA